MNKSLNHTKYTEEEQLAYGGDRLAKRHDAPGVVEEEATSMK